MLRASSGSVYSSPVLFFRMFINAKQYIMYEFIYFLVSPLGYQLYQGRSFMSPVLPKRVLDTNFPSEWMNFLNEWCSSSEKQILKSWQVPGSVFTFDSSALWPVGGAFRRVKNRGWDSRCRRTQQRGKNEWGADLKSKHHLSTPIADISQAPTAS